MLTITSHGRYKLSHIDDYRRTSLPGKGVRNFADNYGEVIFCQAVKLGDRLRINQVGKVTVKVLSKDDIRGRAGKGKKLKKVESLRRDEILVFSD